jgi:hypothetical protein
MATIKINSKTNANFNITANPDPASAFSKYLKSAPAEILLAGELITQWEKPISQTDIKDMSLDVEFKYPVQLGASIPELTINAKTSGKFSINAKAHSNVTGNDYYGDAIEVPEGKAYVTLTIEAVLGAGINPKTGDLSFGFETGRTVTLSYAEIFDQMELLGKAIVHVIENFRIPAEECDLESMPAGSIAAAGGSGSFSIKATYTASVAPNLLAVATPDPIPAGKLSISAKAEAKVAGSAKFTGDYQVRAYRESAVKASFGYHHSTQKELDVQFTADAGIDVQVNGKSALDQILGSLSGEEKLDSKKLADLGIPADEIKAMNEAIKASLNRSINLSVSADLNWSDKISELFRFSFCPGNVGKNGIEWIHCALDGIPDVLLAKDPAQLAAENIVREAAGLNPEVQSAATLKINLLGIFNYLSLSKLIQEGKVLCEPVSGTLTITDKATASRISIAATPFAEIDKLHTILMENVLFSLACHATGLAVSEELSVMHDFFEYKTKMDSRSLAENVAALSAIGLIDPATKEKILNKRVTGHCIYWLSAGFNNAQCRNLLLFKPDANSCDQARPESFYELAGRRALLAITAVLPDEAFRGNIINDDAVWKQLTEYGIPSALGKIPEIHQLNPLQQEVIGTDYKTISWWAHAMNQLGEALIEFDQYIASHKPLDQNSSEFRKVQTNFSKKIASAAQNSETPFGEPWGVLAMNFAADSQDSAIGVLAADGVNLKNKR